MRPIVALCSALEFAPKSPHIVNHGGRRIDGRAKPSDFDNGSMERMRGVVVAGELRRLLQSFH
jgi:hypothetical protein